MIIGLLYTYGYRMRLHGVDSFFGSQPGFSYTRNSPHFVESEESLRHSQVPATCPYPEPDECSPYARILLLDSF